LEVLCVWCLWVEELHLLAGTIVGSNLEWKNINTVEHTLLVNQKLLTVPWVVEILVLLWVLNTCWVTAGDEVGETTSDTGAGVP